MEKPGVSPSRTYVAMCIKPDFDGFYFKKFRVPEKVGKWKATDINTEVASWFFLNRLDFVTCVEKCVTFEDYQNLTDV